MMEITSVEGIGHAEEQNSKFRKTMEDATVMIDKFGNNPELGYFAIFDGHGGPDCSKSAADYVHKILMEHILSLKSKSQNPNDSVSLIQSPSTPLFAPDIKIDIDSLENYKEILTKAMHKADAFMKERGHIYVGCTACICFVSQRNFTLINLGDTRAVLSQNGIAQRLTKDHKAIDKDEGARIKAAGGAIVQGRINGFISVSRALGDHCIKHFVSGEPDIFRYERNKTDEFIIMACDGVWDVMNDQQATDCVKKCLKESGSPQRAAYELKNQAIRLGTQDNVSILILVLKDVGSIV